MQVGGIDDDADGVVGVEGHEKIAGVNSVGQRLAPFGDLADDTVST